MRKCRKYERKKRILQITSGGNRTHDLWIRSLKHSATSRQSLTVMNPRVECPNKTAETRQIVIFAIIENASLFQNSPSVFSSSSVGYVLLSVNFLNSRY